ncbi:MAG: DUF3576 domain-containing protein [Sphingobacteriia bacterium]|nr:DUF3576 domain-containing protein [Sphingobacteriia bacterium]
MKKYILIACLALVMSSCESGNVKHSYPKTAQEKREEEMGRILGDEGVVLAGKKRKVESVGITVNSYLWRAALEAASELPIQIVDPFSGVITTDWYQVTLNDNERFKLSIVITSDVLRADAVKVNVFKQYILKGQWTDAPSNKAMVREIEDRILTRARQLKITSE